MLHIAGNNIRRLPGTFGTGCPFLEELFIGSNPLVSLGHKHQLRDAVGDPWNKDDNFTKEVAKICPQKVEKYMKKQAERWTYYNDTALRSTAHDMRRLRKLWVNDTLLTSVPHALGALPMSELNLDGVPTLPDGLLDASLAGAGLSTFRRKETSREQRYFAAYDHSPGDRKSRGNGEGRQGRAALAWLRRDHHQLRRQRVELNLVLNRRRLPRPLMRRVQEFLSFAGVAITPGRKKNDTRRLCRYPHVDAAWPPSEVVAAARAFSRDHRVLRSGKAC